MVTTEEILRMVRERRIRKITGPDLHCANWEIEGALRMLFNILDPEVAKDPQNLIVYGGRGQAARNWESLEAIVETLLEMEPDETLLVQSGKPVAVFKTSVWAPRVLLVYSHLVPKWATWEYFLELSQKGLIMFGQMTAGGWAYIGHQGIIQGTYQTFLLAAQKAGFGEDLRGRLVVSAGLGEMGGAQPLACVMAGGVGLFAEVRKEAIQRCIEHKYLMEWTEDLDEAIEMVKNALRDKEPLSVAWLGNAVELYEELVKRGITPDILTDQTAAHDPLYGYYPVGLSREEADRLREEDPKKYMELANKSFIRHVRAMNKLMKRGAVTFEYGNALRMRAHEAGLPREEAFAFPGFVHAYIRPLFIEGRCPFRWASLVGDPEDIHKIDDLILREFKHDKLTVSWIQKAREYIPFQGLPARVCWMSYKDQARLAKRVWEMVRKGELSGPIWFGRDHLSGGSVASPTRETEGMKDGSDAIADWPLLSALLLACSGATWVALGAGGGVGVGLSVHAGYGLVVDGSDLSKEKLMRVLTNDPRMSVVRHADAGYEKAIEIAKKEKIWIPMIKETWPHRKRLPQS